MSDTAGALKRDVGGCLKVFAAMVGITIVAGSFWQTTHRAKPIADQVTDACEEAIRARTKEKLFFILSTEPTMNGNKAMVAWEVRYRTSRLAINCELARRDGKWEVVKTSAARMQ